MRFTLGDLLDAADELAMQLVGNAVEEAPRNTEVEISTNLRMGKLVLRAAQLEVDLFERDTGGGIETRHVSQALKPLRISGVSPRKKASAFAAEENRKRWGRTGDGEWAR